MYVNEHVIEVKENPYPITGGPTVVSVKTSMNMSVDEYTTWRRTQESLGNAFDLPEFADKTIPAMTMKEYAEYRRKRQETAKLVQDIETLKSALEKSIEKGKNRMVIRPPVTPEGTDEVPFSELTYKAYAAAYWDYIDAKDGYAAALALDNLKKHVYLGLQPVTVKDGKWAWVHERDEKPPFDYCLLVIQILFFGTIIAGIVCSALGIR